jgi:hypothetical protein
VTDTYADANLPTHARSNGPLMRAYTRVDAALWGEDYDDEMTAAATNTSRTDTEA